MNLYNYMFKYIIIGDTSVGKSCLLLQFTDSTFRREHDATIGVEYGQQQIKLNEKVIKLQIWDTAGQESFKCITRSYYRGSIGAVLVYDVTNRNSFEHVIQWYNDLKSLTTDNIDLVLVGNKIDIENEKREVSTEEGIQMAKKLGIGFVETSAKTGENVDEVFHSMSQRILDKIENEEIDPNIEVQGIKIGSFSRVKKTTHQIESFSPSQPPPIQKQDRCC